jgi:tetratricopeptide (TPR) repeat protein
MSSSATTSTNLDRKSLRRPDEFTQAVKGFFDAIAENTTATLTVLGILFAIGLGYAIYMNHRADRAASAREALYTARTALDAKVKSLLPPPAAPKNAKSDDKKKAATEDAENAAATQTAAEEFQYKKLDVDSQFGPVVKQFEAVAQDYNGTRSAYEARLAIADLYFQHGEAQKALPWYQSAVDAAPNGFERTLSLSALGHAYENAGKPADAVGAYEKGIQQGEASLKGELLLGVARAQQLAGNQDKARQAYDQILSQLPNTEQAKRAESLKARLE